MDRFIRRARRSLLRGLLLPAVLAAAPAFADDPAAAGSATLGPAFATRNAAFTPVSYAQLPGWDSDALHESANGMRSSCTALQRKPAWAPICADFDALDGSDTALRGFFLRNFYAYQVMSPARQPDGLITGYFEPLLDGRRQRDERFRYPVYGLPRDLLMLDASVRAQGPSVWLKVQGNRLLPAEPGAPGAAQYALVLDQASPNIRDKRLRVRLDGATVRPYWTRQEIEQHALDAPVLAWVDDARRLYSLQIQGSGKIELEDGSLIRVAYMEQNGQPFLPNITRSADAGLVLQAIKTRGLRVGATAGALAPDPKVPAAVSDEVSQLIARLSGQAPASPAATAAIAQGPATTSPPGKPPRVSGNTDVQAMIAALMGQAAPAPASSSSKPAAALARPAASSVPASLALTAPADTGSGSATVSMPVASSGGTGIPDPSYVFFRNTGGDGPEGPVGALGVPLSAGRSLAVDPRSIPLGSPVFISTKDPARRGPLQRLMFAQDTGGAIRGSVRADLFWGFGDSAGQLALATNDRAQMWLLLPHAQAQAAAAASGPATRGLRDKTSLPDCVVDDPDLCVEE